MNEVATIEGALARFVSSKRDTERYAEDDIAARGTYTVERVLAHTDVAMLINDMDDAASILAECMDMPGCPDAIRARHSSLALRDWCRWIKEPAKA